LWWSGGAALNQCCSCNVVNFALRVKGPSLREPAFSVFGLQ
jgi:hypothetical protein